MNVRRIRRALSTTLLLSTTLALGACGAKSPTAPSVNVNVPFSTQDAIVGTGDEAVAGKLLTVGYFGWLYDASKPNNRGQQFDASNSFQFTLGANQVIAGWEQGIPGMRVGGVRLLTIPPNLAYGNVPVGIIPANSTLVFQVSLLSVQ